MGKSCSTRIYLLDIDHRHWHEWQATHTHVFRLKSLRMRNETNTKYVTIFSIHFNVESTLGWTEMEELEEKISLDLNWPPLAYITHAPVNCSLK